MVETLMLILFPEFSGVDDTRYASVPHQFTCSIVFKVVSIHFDWHQFVRLQPFYKHFLAGSYNTIPYRSFIRHVLEDPPLSFSLYMNFEFLLHKIFFSRVCILANKKTWTCMTWMSLVRLNDRLNLFFRIVVHSIKQFLHLDNHIFTNNHDHHGKADDGNCQKDRTKAKPSKKFLANASVVSHHQIAQRKQIQSTCHKGLKKVLICGYLV
mmetsp:Transcript_463/g.864  ORF Transcript_463/g.864 Transcript_463/m.864 type:complete len:210 (+) Transcript_463:648-1277(+)